MTAFDRLDYQQQCDVLGVGKHHGAWSRPPAPHPANAKRWARFCQFIVERIENTRRASLRHTGRAR